MRANNDVPDSAFEASLLLTSMSATVAALHSMVCTPSGYVARKIFPSVMKPEIPLLPLTQSLAFSINP